MILRGYQQKQIRAGWLLGQLNRLGRSIAIEQQAAAEDRIKQFQTFADDCLSQIDSSDVTTARLIKAESHRLAGLCFDITQALLHGNTQKAYNLSRSGDHSSQEAAG